MKNARLEELSLYTPVSGLIECACLQFAKSEDIDPKSTALYGLALDLYAQHLYAGAGATAPTETTPRYEISIIYQFDKGRHSAVAMNNDPTLGHEITDEGLRCAIEDLLSVAGPRLRQDRPDNRMQIMLSGHLEDPSRHTLMRLAALGPDDVARLIKACT